jgi:nitrogen fixation protein NifZ
MSVQLPDYEYGDEVRVIRSIRNDGTVPGLPRGALLVRRGECGYVRDVGVFLQDQIIYQVHFLAVDKIVGCREQELIASSEPWIASVFEFGDWVQTTCHLAIQGQVIAPQGTIGQVFAVHRDSEPLQYEVLFGDRILAVHEPMLRWPEDAAAE